MPAGLDAPDATAKPPEPRGHPRLMPPRRDNPESPIGQFAAVSDTAKLASDLSDGYVTLGCTAQAAPRG